MEGAWRVYPPGERWRRPATPPGSSSTPARGRRRLPAGHRRAGARASTRTTVVGHLGPDLLGPDWDAHEAVRRLAADPDRPLGEALLDQRNLAGIGNIYRSETLFLSGVSPFLPVSAVGNLPKVVDLARRLLLANRARPQITTTGNPRRGEQLWVYGRAGERCRRCRTPILRAMQGQPPYDRVTFWCPSCQPQMLDQD